jgi:hypothetical protein
MPYKKRPPDYLWWPFKKVGDDLLSRECSTIGANGLNFPVRNG